MYSSKIKNNGTQGGKKSESNRTTEKKGNLCWSMKVVHITESSKPERKNRRWIQYVAVFTATLSLIASGMHYGWTSPALPKLMAPNSPIPVTTNAQGSWIASLCLLGDLIGAPLSALGADHFGRKPTILLGSIPYFVAWIMIAFTKSVEVLYCARFLAGVGDGVIYTIIPMYIGEIAEDNIRGLLSATIPTMLNLGILIIYIIGPYVSIMSGALISSLFPLILLLTFCWMPESQYYLLMKDCTSAAKRSLQKLRGKNSVDNELSELSQIVREQMEHPTSVKELLLTASNRKALLIVMGLKTVQQFSGISAFLFYGQSIFEMSGGGVAAGLSSILFGLVQLLSNMFSFLFVDRLGRKPLLIASCLGTALCLIVQGIYFYLQDCTDIDLNPYSYVPISVIILFIISYSFGLGLIPYIMPGELFPTNIKSKALCIIDLYFALIAFSIAKIYQIIADAFGSFVPFFLFTVCCVLSLGFAVLCVPETQGRSLEEIQYWLKGHKDYGKQIQDNNGINTHNDMQDNNTF